ncbi:HlyD family secretion protein [Neolewinella litorea]|uniref:HlyD family efflux transporter periplasmic adaptor subunit n=1 Tax=Neolewinella litorea TaxID=2562452 RepID=A0A4S4NS61_9BACT|nr:HlyD family efflux transporter periplasmic adaptor subunit [Neolewinella litorea]THH42075.1 HlyD family efflux transporter periplasmic adaptor subunit [Neolewinella litorea]
MPTEAPPLYPFPLVEGVEGLYARHGRTSRLLYLTVVLALLIAAAALPLIQIDVNTRSRGMLRPGLQLSPVAAAVSGRVLTSNLRENAEVCAGDTLLRLTTDELGSEADHLRAQVRERRQLLADLHALEAATHPDYPTLGTAIYQRDYREYRRRHDEATLKLDHARRHAERQRELLATGSVARMEVEQSEYERELLAGQLQQLTEQQQRSWTQDRQRLNREVADLRRELHRLDERSRQYVVTAPLDGQLTQTGGLQAGTFVSAGQLLAQISPDGELRAEAYVSPADIGLLREGLPVRLQLDAFNYQQWGLAKATLSEIGTDVTEIDGSAAFRVVCTLRDRELRLRNGYRGTLRKGMTLTAHFTLARRSLFQLLRDRVDDWLNPLYY